jgi:hypothetical protein
MQKNTWLLLLPSALSAVLAACPAHAEWNMTKSIKDLLANPKPASEGAKKEDGKMQAVQQESSAQNRRFKDNGDGTLLDKSTGLIWLKNANCAVFFENDASVKNSRPWHEARVAASELSDGFCGLSDNSKPGDWRLPEREELLGIARQPEENANWAAGKAFNDIQSFYYWSSTLGDLYPDFAFYVSLAYGMDNYAFQLNSFHLLPVRKPKKQQAALSSVSK